MNYSQEALKEDLHHWGHEQDWNERHDNASCTPIFVPWILFSVFIRRVNIFDKLKLEICMWKVDKKLRKDLLTENGENESRKQVDALNKYEAVEVRIVALADAVIDPWAVMVVSINTNAA